MTEEVKDKLESPISARFNLPENLEQRFYELIPQSPGKLALFPAIFARVLINYMEEEGYLTTFLDTAESYLQQKIRQFFTQVAGLGQVRWSAMDRDAYYNTVVRPHVKALQFVLRDAFHYLEMQAEHSEQLTATTQLLSDAESAHGELAVALEGFRTRVEELSSEATTDALTGLQNRKVLERRCAKFAIEMPDEPFVYMIMDMDRFKEVNDKLGHHAGDMAIQQLAGLISSHDVGVRYDDVIRLGGEEFVILIRNKDGRGEKIAKKVREIMEEYTFTIEDNAHVQHNLKKTISIGLCHCTGKELSNNVAYNKADRALQLAKGKQFSPDGLLVEGQEDPDGRNRVWVYGRTRAEHREGRIEEDTFDGSMS